MIAIWEDANGKTWLYGAGEAGATKQWNGVSLTCRMVDQAELDSILSSQNTPRPDMDLSNIDNLDKVLKSIGLLLRQYTNALQAGTHTQKTVAQLKSDFAQIYNNLP
jgi:hypothetical protein